MQDNSNTRFFRSFMVGLIASGAGAFVALPSTAMPEPADTSAAAEVIEEPAVEAVEEVPAPAASETLPSPEEGSALEAEAAEESPIVEVDALEDAPAVEAEALEEEPIVEEPALEEEPLVEEPLVEEPLVEEPALEEEPLVEEPALEEEPLVEEPALEEEPIVEEPALEETPAAEGEIVEEAPVVEGEDMETADFTIAELTDSSDSFEILAAALAAADLTEVLGAEGPYTVFAPTDEAFEALPEGAVEQLLLPENKDVLAQVLTYHVVPGTLLAADLESGTVGTVEGSDIAVEVTESAVTVDNANVLVADVEASNGVIHIIDRVIIPPAPEGVPEDAPAAPEEVAPEEGAVE